MIPGASLVKLVVKFIEDIIDYGVALLFLVRKADIMNSEIGIVIQEVKDRIFLAVKVTVLKIKIKQAQLGLSTVFTIELLLLGLKGFCNIIVLHQA